MFSINQINLWLLKPIKSLVWVQDIIREQTKLTHKWKLDKVDTTCKFIAIA